MAFVCWSAVHPIVFYLTKATDVFDEYMDSKRDYLIIPYISSISKWHHFLLIKPVNQLMIKMGQMPVIVPSNFTQLPNITELSKVEVGFSIDLGSL
ncbi:hypothetical protein [Flavisolibacter tropicus]|uniref:Uncharacterized protein n=1 Tax=Flavisolibacter tropicus TaxID=1492898 RepID=A0A172TUB2_9BACT|nr:hypothetical protein [Flavisolibacter tropicus]ANE50464.1 hypothetical protein SY85_08125 [Flavisolibacter tropicus]